MSEQQNQTPTAVQATPSACPHPEAVGTRWGDPIPPRRQAELQGIVDAWDAPGTNHGDRKSPFDLEGLSIEERTRRKLTGADVTWLAEQSRDDTPIAGPNLHLERVDLSDAHLEGAHLSGSHLEEANLTRAYLEKADLSFARLEHAHLRLACLEHAHLTGSRLEHANLTDTRLEHAHLSGSRLEHANLTEAHLEDANLREAHLEGTDLSFAHLEGARLDNAHLEHVDLRGAWLDSKTVLTGVTLDKGTRLGDIQWNGVGSVNLTTINWGKMPTLGDEQNLGRHFSVASHEGVVRAYRQVAAQLRAQGMNEVADHFLYRAQVLQRRVLRRQGRLYASIGSWFLDLISGHGYKPARSVIAYIVIICAFAAAYLLNAQFAAPHLTWDEALVLSISSFHGRGFFTSGISLGDTLARLAAAEAIVGLLIEITFIATFTQRFFAR